MVTLKGLQISLATIYIASCSALVSISPVSAEIKIDCANPGSNIEYKECAYRAYQAADKKLNQVYKPIFNSLSGKEKQNLVNAQSLWIKFRDANCDFEVYRNRGGTGYGGFLSNCLERMTQTRISELQEWQK